MTSTTSTSSSSSSTSSTSSESSAGECPCGKCSEAPYVALCHAVHQLDDPLRKAVEAISWEHVGILGNPSVWENENWHYSPAEEALEVIRSTTLSKEDEFFVSLYTGFDFHFDPTNKDLSDTPSPPRSPRGHFPASPEPDYTPLEDYPVFGMIPLSMFVHPCYADDWEESFDFWARQNARTRKALCEAANDPSSRLHKLGQLGIDTYLRDCADGYVRPEIRVADSQVDPVEVKDEPRERVDGKPELASTTDHQSDAGTAQAEQPTSVAVNNAAGGTSTSGSRTTSSAATKRSAPATDPIPPASTSSSTSRPNKRQKESSSTRPPSLDSQQSQIILQLDYHLARIACLGKRKRWLMDLVRPTGLSSMSSFASVVDKDDTELGALLDELDLLSPSTTPSVPLNAGTGLVSGMESAKDSFAVKLATEAVRLVERRYLAAPGLPSTIVKSLSDVYTRFLNTPEITLSLRSDQTTSVGLVVADRHTLDSARDPPGMILLSVDMELNRALPGASKSVTVGIGRLVRQSHDGNCLLRPRSNQKTGTGADDNGNGDAQDCLITRSEIVVAQHAGMTIWQSGQEITLREE